MVRKVLVVVVSAVCLAVACGLAWWQWERFSSANGSWQNLGYVLQWPLFGLAPAYMFWRLRKLKAQQDEGAPVPDGPTTTTASAAPVRVAPDHDDDDPELAEYNRYLARLAQQEKR